MLDKIDITVNGDNFIRAIHTSPEETSTTDIDRTLVLMLHDFPGNKFNHDNVYGDLEELLNRKGFHALRFDFRGCGESDGEQTHFSLSSAKQDMEAVMIWAQNNGYEEFVCISEGLGTIIGLLNLPLRVKCQVMLWPGLNPNALATKLFNGDNIEDEWRKIGYTIHHDHRIGVQFIDELREANIAPSFRDLNMPLLVLHGASDERYPISDLNHIRKRASSKRIEITTFHDAGCGLPQPEHRESMFFHIGQFLEKFA